MSSLELPRAVSLSSVPPSSISGGEGTTDGGIRGGFGSLSLYNQRAKFNDTRDISIQVLEKFSLVTKFARETTSQLFREPQNNGFGDYETKIPSQPANDHTPKSSSRVKDAPITVPVPSDPLEVMIATHLVLFNCILICSSVDTTA